MQTDLYISLAIGVIILAGAFAACSCKLRPGASPVPVAPHGPVWWLIVLILAASLARMAIPARATFGNDLCAQHLLRLEVYHVR
jgi:hypothetical protein